jgi:lipopolysaccharide transport system ATP-binding protein
VYACDAATSADSRKISVITPFKNDMTDDVVIQAEGVGKKYRIGHQAERERYVALRDVLAHGARQAWSKTADLVRGRRLLGGDTVEEFWALKDVSLEVRRGEVLGIIGRNGAGKTTLLKILSRITEPSEGRVTIRGRVASLLEVGTGFHPELTGRENIYLNGAILGMTRAEIHRKFDEIVAFAEVEKFLDTPVKRYSSGMYVRLAFAVAAHLETEILLVDEVLAVGDTEFQKKCLGKITEVASGGRTVLFVSHNLPAVEALCSRCLHFASGALVNDAEPSHIIAGYLQQRPTPAPARSINVGNRLAIDRILIKPPTVRTGDAIQIEVDFRARDAGRLHECALLIYSLAGVRVAIIDTRESGMLPFAYTTGQFTVTVVIDSVKLVEGDFTLGLYLVTESFQEIIQDIADFIVVAPKPTRSFVPYIGKDRGFVVLSAQTCISADPAVPLLHRASNKLGERPWP